MWQVELASLMPMEADGLRYRPTRDVDAELHQRLYKNLSREAALDAVVRRHLGMAGLYVVEDISVGQAVGECGFIANRDIPETDTSIMLLPQFQHCGYGRRILRTLYGLWVNELRRDSCFATVLSTNSAAISLLASGGFSQVREYNDFFQISHLVFERRRDAAAT